tara:strand:+ start:71 stop:574 length:504 start_codon:yes stop_codon:yes gene_type:complete
MVVNIKISTGAIILLLLVGLILLNYFVFIPTLEQVIDSRVLVNESVYVKKDVLDALNILYESHDTEWVTCGKGSINNVRKTTMITSLQATKILESTRHSALFNPCPDNTIVWIHNHPSGTCTYSPEDVFVFGTSKQPLMGVMCGKNRLAIYSQKTLRQGGLKVKVVK